MVCKDCESKLSKVIVPDKWKDGARNTTGGADGGRATTYRNSLLQVRGKNQRFQASTRGCRICKSKVAQDAYYCQECAHHNGICAMCGKRTVDLRFARRGGVDAASAAAKRKPEPEAAGGGEYGTSERFKRQKAEEERRKAEDEELEAQAAEARAALAAAQAAPVHVPEPEDPRIARERAVRTSGLDAVSAALARNRGRTINSADNPGDDYKHWASASDASTGKTYYYNSATRETSWVWPPVPASTVQAPAANPLAAGAAPQTLSDQQMEARDRRLEPGSHGRDLSHRRKDGKPPPERDDSKPSWMSEKDLGFGLR